MTRKPEFGGLQSAVANLHFDHLGISGGRIRANNRGVVSLP
jgi:hypothetical protein